MRTVRLAVVVAMALLLSSCAFTDPVQGQGRDCHEMLGVYPPETIVIEGLRPVDVPYTSWSCLGYDSDTFTAQLPTLPSAANGEVTIKVEFRDDPVFEIRAETERERIILDGEIDGESVTFRLPEATEILWVRLCTSDGRCANYQARVEQ
jgi:hypothetical protein